MPTGYTSGVADGTVTDFREYALQCARAFGALILMRDDPQDAPIPDEFEASTWNAVHLKQARFELTEFQGMTLSQRQAAWKEDQEERATHAEEGLRKTAEQRERYERMLAEAKAYEPPTAEHANYAKFLVSQLEESIRFDCSTEYYEKQKQQIPFTEWEERRVASLEHDIGYHSKAQAEEEERTAGRTSWVRALKRSLGIGVEASVV